MESTVENKLQDVSKPLATDLRFGKGWFLIQPWQSGILFGSVAIWMLLTHFHPGFLGPYEHANWAVLIFSITLCILHPWHFQWDDHWIEIQTLTRTRFLIEDIQGAYFAPSKERILIFRMKNGDIHRMDFKDLVQSGKIREKFHRFLKSRGIKVLTNDYELIKADNNSSLSWATGAVFGDAAWQYLNHFVRNTHYSIPLIYFIAVTSMYLQVRVTAPIEFVGSRVIFGGLKKYDYGLSEILDIKMFEDPLNVFLDRRFRVTFERKGEKASLMLSKKAAEEFNRILKGRIELVADLADGL